MGTFFCLRDRLFRWGHKEHMQLILAANLRSEIISSFVLYASKILYRHVIES